jgi:hypothetical protein
MKPIKIAQNKGGIRQSNGGGELDQKHIICMYGNTTMEPFVQLLCSIKN